MKKYCDESCRAAAKNARRTPVRYASCQRDDCEKVLDDKKRTYCSDTCRSKAYSNQGRKAQKERTCSSPECEVDITAMDARSRYCSRTCRSRAAYLKNPEAIGARAKAYYQNNKEVRQGQISARREVDLVRIQERDRAYHHANREVRNAAARAWWQRNPERVKELARKKSEALLKMSPEARAVLKARKRDSMLMRKFGITSRQYDALLQERGEVCEVCGTKGSSTSGASAVARLAVDHSHSTGVVRGLLCVSCNVHLFLVEQPAWQERFESYLSRTRPILADVPGPDRRTWDLDRFGMTVGQYHQLLASQAGVCAICHRTEGDVDKRGKAKRLSVDHSHDELSTPFTPRGLLCGYCNRSLGWYENKAWWGAAEAYLEASAEGCLVPQKEGASRVVVVPARTMRLFPSAVLRWGESQGADSVSSAMH